MNIFLPLALLVLGLDAAAANYVGKPDCRILNYKVDHGDYVTWSGACVDGHAHGKGVLQLFHWREAAGGYDGVIEHGLLQGEGEQFFVNGDSYKGVFRDGKPNGMGVYRHADGTSVSGEFIDGDVVAGSQVVCMYPGGDRYTGGWRDGMPDGQGERHYALGGNYQGGWKNGEFSGQGTIRYPNGIVLSKEFAPAPAADTATSQRYTFTPTPPGKRRQVNTILRPSRFPTSSAEVPFEAGYTELTAEQQRLVKRDHPILQAADEPPYPLDGLAPFYRDVSAAMYAVPLDGELRLDVMVDAEGQATEVKVLQSPTQTPEYKLLFVTSAMRQKYKPAQCAGAPCAMAYPIHLELRIE